VPLRSKVNGPSRRPLVGRLSMTCGSPSISDHVRFQSGDEDLVQRVIQIGAAVLVDEHAGIDSLHAFDIGGEGLNGP
jgi:precorrin isomerase